MKFSCLLTDHRGSPTSELHLWTLNSHLLAINFLKVPHFALSWCYFSHDFISSLVDKHHCQPLCWNYMWPEENLTSSDYCPIVPSVWKAWCWKAACTDSAADNTGNKAPFGQLIEWNKLQMDLTLSQKMKRYWVTHVLLCASELSDIFSSFLLLTNQTSYFDALS